MSWAGIFKAAMFATGGMTGWVVAEFKPAFPLVVVAVIFILYDAWTAYRLDRRAHAAYPKRTARHEAEHWVFVPIHIPLSYVITGVICFEQAWSILENESSCRPEAEHRFWKALQRIMVDKTARHFDVDLEKFEKGNGKDEESPAKD